MIGQTFSHWTVLSPGTKKFGTAHWLCRCTCGVEREVNVLNLIKGKSTSCGRCSRIGSESATFKHGKTGTPLHNIWLLMKDRCNNSNHQFYHRYGGRGIKVCDRWHNSFLAFEEDMGPRPSSAHSIDRINNDKGYEPSNCRWATKTEQVRNRDVTLSDTDGKPLAAIAEDAGIRYNAAHKRYRNGERGERLSRPHRERRSDQIVTYRGAMMTIAEAARAAGVVRRETVRCRLAKGWSVEDAVETPVSQ